MNAIQTLLTENIGIWSAADTEEKSGRGRSSGNSASVFGIKKLRELILELAVRGKLVPRDTNDEPASVLLKRIQAEKAKLIAEGKVNKEKPLQPITECEKPFELSQGWEWTRLGEITNFGSTEKLGSISDETWVLDLEDIEKDTSKLLQKFRFSERRSLSDKNSFQAGDVLYGKLRPYLNKVLVADEAGVCTTEILPIRCYGSFDSHYFKVALKSPCFVNYVNARSYGMKMPRLGTEDGRKACFPLPPLAEQHRIVAKVDELMALCDQLETQHNNAAEAHEKLVGHLLGTLTESQSPADFNSNWQRVAAHFDTLFTTEASIDALKQTLLQLAVMGKLVPQDPNNEPASELLKRIQAEKAELIGEGKIKKDKPLPPITDEEKQFALPFGWERVRLGVLVEKSGAGWSPNCEGHPRIENDWGVLKVSAVSWGEFLPDENKSLPNSLEARLDCVVEAGDFLVSRANTAELVARSVVVEDCPPNLMLSDKIVRLRLTMLCNKRFINIANSSSFARSYYSLVAGGTSSSMKNVSREQILNLIVGLPPLAEQLRIVIKFDELMALCDQLKTRITQANQLQQKLADVLVEQAA